MKPPSTRDESRGRANRLAPLFASSRGDWETPPDLFADLQEEFGFDLDAAADAGNALCERFYSAASLDRDWTEDADGTRFRCVYVNPPYGRDVGRWVAKARQTAERGVRVVLLLPARTDTRWFHDEVLGRAEVRFLRGRLRFRLDGLSLHPAPFPSMVVIFHALPQCARVPGSPARPTGLDC
jgi:phage N-6-adenine-methyltransferase